MMNRRRFLQGTGTAALAIEAGAAPRDIYPELIQPAEQAAEKSLPRQQPDGGLADDYEIPSPGATAGFLSALAAVYAVPESRFQRDADLLRRMERAAENLVRVQRPDGTIDLPSTNFGSPPDTGFVLEPVCAVAAVLRKCRYEETRKLEASLEAFIRRAGEALAVGGIHTPNHRWVVVAALARCHRLFPNPRYLSRIDDWLAEGIDQDADGHFTERSVGVYNAACDNMLLTAARLLERPALLDPVRKNLEAMLYFVRPGGELATEISRRQDHFALATLRPYYRAYKYMAARDGNGRFASAAEAIEREHAGQLGSELIHFIEVPELRRPGPPPLPLPEDYDRFWPSYEFAHVRRGAYDGTLLGRDSRFFSFRHGGAVVEAVRLASAFFGKGQFAAPLVRASGGYRLEQTLDGDYLQPLEPKDRRADGDWLKMPRDRRARSNRFTLRSKVEIREVERGFDIAVEVGGTDRVPAAIEIALRPGGRLSGDGLRPAPRLTEAHLLAEGYATYEVAGRGVRIGPGFRRHGWTQLRGAGARLPGLSLYLTEITPFTRRLEVRSV
jgi:hypothetical protein